MATLVQFENGEQLTIDATTARAATTSVELTKHPIESGAFVSDHQIRRPVDLKLEGTLVDYPLGAARDEGEPGRAARWFDRMEAAQLAGETVTVVSPDKQWERMKFVSLSAPLRRAGTINFTASLEQVQIVETQTVAVTKSNLPKGKGKTNGGRQTGTEATPSEKRKSLAAKLNDKAFDAFGKLILGD